MRWKPALQSLGVALAAMACVPAINLLGGTLAEALLLPRGGTGRLAWDLGALLLSVFMAVWLPARWARLWPRVLAVMQAGLCTAAVAWAAWSLASDFPRWFVAGALLGTPAMAAIAMTLGARRPIRQAATST